MRDAKLYSEESDINEIPKETRPSYSPTPPILGENLISLICYLNDLERKGYFNQKYDYALTVYALNKITQWITPFTTKTIQNIIPAYNPSLVFTCDYCNTHIMKTSKTLQWKALRSSIKRIKRQNYYQKFMAWYSGASSDEKIIFTNCLQERAKDIFLSFIYCPNERISFPATTLTPEERSKIWNRPLESLSEDI